MKIKDYLNEKATTKKGDKVVITTKEKGSKYKGTVSYIDQKKDLLVLDDMVILDKSGDFKVSSKTDKKRNFKLSKLSNIEKV